MKRFPLGGKLREASLQSWTSKELQLDLLLLLALMINQIRSFIFVFLLSSLLLVALVSLGVSLFYSYITIAWFFSTMEMQPCSHHHQHYQQRRIQSQEDILLILIAANKRLIIVNTCKRLTYIRKSYIQLPTLLVMDESSIITASPFTMSLICS